MSVYGTVTAVYELPPDPRTGLEMVPREKQMEVIEQLGPLPRAGMYAEVGTGKTLMATVIALLKAILDPKLVIVVVMPPILLVMWYRWLSKVRMRAGGAPGLRIALYVGKPADRKQINLADKQVILMSLGIFKNDFEHLSFQLEHRPRYMLVDEATSIKNSTTQNHKRVREFTEGQGVLPMTGTPLSNPGDAYGYVKLVSPTVYRNLRHFESLHVVQRDFFGNVEEWGQLDFLSANLLLNSVRLLKRDALPNLKEPLYIPIDYELEPIHARLYRKLAEEQILLLENGGKIDATVPQRLYNMLQQIVCNPGVFSGDPTMRSAAHEVLDGVIDQVGCGKPGGGKLLISANYRMTNAGLLQYLAPYGAVAIYGDISQKNQNLAVQRFNEDPSCSICIINPQAGGMGLDGFQHVCSNIIFPELPQVPRDFHQPVGRLDRDGQTEPVLVHIMSAVGTCQVRLQKNLLTKDALVNRVQGGWKDLREAMFGE